MKISEILKNKGHSPVVWLRPDDSLMTAMHRMKIEHIGCIIASEDGKTPLGILSVRDIVYAMASHGSDHGLSELVATPETQIHEVMTKKLTVCNPDDSLHDVMKEMTRWRYWNMPVMEEDVLVGVIGIDDVVKHGVQEMELEANILRDTLIRKS
ncbi:MAG: CBS domain-containing protein [Rhodospirillales bacterium]|nr:CBS domain-containing protein [Rhodospirillales bacterium]